MFLAGIGTAGVISALFFWQTDYSWQVLLFPFYLAVFVCGLLIWLFILFWAILHDSRDRQEDIRKVAKLVKLIAPITILNMCASLQVPKQPLLVHFLLIFQVSSNLALLLIWAYLSLTTDMFKILIIKFILIFSKKERSVSQPKKKSCFESAEKGSVARYTATLVAVHDIDGVGGKVDEAEGSGSGHGSGSSGSEENRGSYGGNDGTGGASGGGDRGASGSGHGCGASGSGGGSEGGDRRRDGGGTDLECEGRGTNTKKAFKSFKISKMSIMLTAQTVGTVIASNAKPTPSSSLLVAPSSSLLVVALIDQLVGYLCGFTSLLLSSKNPGAAKIFAGIGFVCTALGVILVIAMFLVWYLVLIVVLGFGGFCLIFLRNELKTPATEVWNYLKNSTQNLKNCIGMYFECGS